MYDSQTGYGLEIIGGSEGEAGYVTLPHGSSYAIFLNNRNGNKYCNATIEIDGESVGTWRLAPYQSATIERPADQAKKFTFFALDSEEAIAGQLDSVSKEKLGLVSVTFTPELVPTVGVAKGIEQCARDGEVTCSGSKGIYDSGATRGGGMFGAGGTALSGKSNQEFGKAGFMHLDTENAFTINLRLVVDKSKEITPLRQRGTPVPPPIG